MAMPALLMRKSIPEGWVRWRKAAKAVMLGGEEMSRGWNWMVVRPPSAWRARASRSAGSVVVRAVTASEPRVVSRAVR
jgi:hypothetical protein